VTLLLDTDTVIDWLEDVLPPAQVELLQSSVFSTSVITFMEVLEGIREGDIAAHSRLYAFTSRIVVHHVTDKTARIAASIRRDLRQTKAQVNHRALDILIAATAIEYDLILVTRNTRHFQDIEGLRLWPATTP
jgi:predicted nucleic acid-binding protein